MNSRQILTTAAIVASTASSYSAEYVKGYTRGTGSQLLAANGGGASVLFVDQAITGGNDLIANGGNPTWGWEIDGSASWALTDKVVFTGLAMPIWANDPTTDGVSNTQNATHRIRIYSCGENDSFDGASVDTLLGTVDVDFTSADAGVDEYYANFDEPVVWESADSTKFYFYIQAIDTGTGVAMRFKTGAPSATSVLKNRVNGNPMTVSGVTATSVSFAGIVNEVTWFGDNEDDVSAGTADWDTTSLNWAGGTKAYVDGDPVVFDESFDGKSSNVNLTTLLAPASITVSNSVGGAVPEYVFSGPGGLTGETGLAREGNGTLIIENEGGNDYSGGTSIGGGTIRLGISDALSPLSSLTMGGTTGTSMLQLNGFDQTIAGLNNAGSSTRLIVNGSSTLSTLTVAGGGNYNSQIGNVAVDATDDDNNFSLVKTGPGTLNVVGGNNNYNGGTTIYEGTYMISADNGLGAAPASPTMDSIVLDGGVLRAHMASSTGGSFEINENRLITLFGSGGTIQATTPSGAWVVTYNGVISGSGGLTKTSGQSLALGGDNTYTGPTTVNGGILRLTGSLLSDVTVQSGSSLIPGDQATGSGSGSMPALTFEDGGILRSFINSSTVSAGRADVAGAVVIGATARLIINDSAEEPAILPDGTKLTLIDYGGGSLSGTFSSLEDGASIDVGPNTFIIDYDDEGSLVTLTATSDPYIQWAKSNITDIDPTASAGFDDDPDGDGVDNGLEFILGGDPLLVDGSSLIDISKDESNVTFSFDRSDDSVGTTTLTFQWGGNLIDWNDVPVTSGDTTDGDGINVKVTDGSGVDSVVVTVPQSLASDGKLFSRLLATQP